MKKTNYRRLRKVATHCALEQLEPRCLLDSTVVFNEIMYNPMGADDNLEWVELHNQMSVDVDLSNWSIKGGIEFAFPEGAMLPGGEYAIVASDPSLFNEDAERAYALGPFTGRLDNAGEGLRLVNYNDRVMDSIDYSDRWPWPIAPDGSGVSLAKVSPQSGTSNPNHWRASREIGGTPGAANFSSDVEPAGVLINEVDSVDSRPFRVELLNAGEKAVSLADLRLRISSDGGTGTEIPNQILAPGQLFSFEATVGEIQVGDRLILHSADNTRVHDVARMQDRLTGRSIEYDNRWLYPSAPTFGEPNLFQFATDVVVNEIFYHGPTRPATSSIPPIIAEETVVEFNSNWRHSKDFTFGPSDLPLDPGENWYQSQHLADQIDWLEGAGPFGISVGRTPLALETRFASPRLVTNEITTYYFEHEFDLTAEQTAALDQLIVRYMVNDGAVFYLNGHEVERVNMPEGVINSETRASSAVNRNVVAESHWNVNDLLVALPERNRLSVEVHQFDPRSEDVLFGMELINRTVVDPGSPPRDAVESDEEWIELFNRGDGPVDLTNWGLAEAVRFEFPEATTIDPGEYLIVARNAARLRAKYPDITSRIVGSFDGNLADGGEPIWLLDAFGNPADHVHYFDDGRWSRAADGGGSSLELRDVWADNGSPEAWSASIESARSTWKTYSYRQEASRPTRAGLPQGYHEFILGLLDAGEVLIDDLRVIEDPGGVASDRLQNGDFEEDAPGASPNAWRLVGNHFGEVITDPDDPTNQVLRLVATGATEHMSNHAETTFADDATVRRNETYEVSFRAKWISGSPQVNTRLYYNLAPETTVIDIPAEHGTPGRINSTHVENIGPAYAELRHEPLVPGPDDEVRVSVRANDPQGVSSMTLFYATRGSDFTAVPMERNADGAYVAAIPPQRNRAVVQFYTQGTDSLGAVSSFPAEGPNSRALYKVTTRDLSEDVHSLRIITTTADSVLLHRDTNVMSNHRLGATVIYDENQVFYDVGVRLRASGYGRRGSLVGFNIRFHPDQLFRGVHRTIAIDRGVVISNGNGVGPVRGQPGASPHELLIYQIAHRAGQLPGMYDDVVFVDAPRTGNSGLSLLKTTRYSNVFLDSQFENGGDGSLFKYELIYHTTVNRNRDPEALKTSPNAVVATPITDLGDDKEAYRLNFVLRNNRDKDHFQPIVELGQAFALGANEIDAAAREIIDIDQWMRYVALHSLTGGADTYNMGLAHNMMLYVRPEDQKILAFPWDVDHGFFYNFNSPLAGRGGSNLAKLIRRPQNLRLVYKHLLDITQTTYNNEVLDPWIDHYTEITNVDVGDFLKGYVRRRSEFVLQELDKVAPSIEFQISTNDGASLEIPDKQVDIEGTGWINVHELRVNGAEPQDVTWTDESTWTVTVPLDPGENLVSLEAVDLHGRIVGTDSITITSSVTDRPLSQFLRLTEIMFNPPRPSQRELSLDPSWQNDDFEYLEFTNSSPDRTLDLSGVKITDGPREPFEFVPGQRLQPGERLLVVVNALAMEARYGNSLNIAGEYQGKLDNQGERIRIEDPFGKALIDFRYDSGDPWPQSADGIGASLELVDPSATPANGLGKFHQWRGSLEYGGSPGNEAADPVGVVINEVLANSDLPNEATDSIELYNPTDSAMPIGGWYLSDESSDLRKFQIPLGTLLPSQSYVVFDERHFNPGEPVGSAKPFALSGSRGDDVWLVAPDDDGNLATFVDHVAFTASLSNTSLGRMPDGRMLPMTAVTLGAKNSSVRIGPVIVSEINSRPGEPSAAAKAIDPNLTTDDLEYVELFNSSREDVDLTDWRLSGGVEMEFPAGTHIPAGQPLLVLPFNPQLARNQSRFAAFLAHYEISSTVPVAGGFQGQLADRGELLRLEMPDHEAALELSFIPRVIADELNYDDAAPWPQADGKGNSLHRIDNFAWGGVSSSWTSQSPNPGESLLFVPAAGDSDLNRQFDQNDIVRALQGARYLSAQPASWSEGDWNRDGVFDQLDIVGALQTNNYLQGPYAALDALLAEW